MIVYDKEQKEIVIPNGIGNINLFNNGVEAGYNQGKTDGINEQKSKLESIIIINNGTYRKEDGYNKIVVDVPDLNGSYEEGYYQGQADMAANARVLNVTENGVYRSKFSDDMPPIGYTVTGVYDDGTEFHSCAELNGKVFNTKIEATIDSRLEFWYKGDHTAASYGWDVIIGAGNNDNSNTFQVRYFVENNNIIAVNLGNDDIVLDGWDDTVWHHLIVSKAEGLWIDGEKKIDFSPTNTINGEFFINGINYDVKIYGGGVKTANGCFGMIKIDDTTIIPTANGFKNVNTGELLEVVQDGGYTFRENDPIYGEGELYKTINVNVPDLNGSYDEGYAQGKTDGINEQKSKLESINITENGTYRKEDGYNEVVVNVADLNGSYDEGYDQGQADAAANARVLNVTENGSYVSKYTKEDEIVMPFDLWGDDFYSYAYVKNKIYNTGIIPNENTRLEFWFKPDEGDYMQDGSVVIMNNAGSLYGSIFGIFHSTAGDQSYYANVGGDAVNFRLTNGVLYHIVLSVADGLVINGEQIGTFSSSSNFSEPLYINGMSNDLNASADGEFGMIKIDNTIIIPTENGFLNQNTNELLEVVYDSGLYKFTEISKPTIEGNLYRTINVNVVPKINVKEAGIKFAYGTFTEVPEWADFEGVTNMDHMFRNCDNLQTIPQIDTSNATNMSYMFGNCSKLRTISLIDTSNVTDMSFMFTNCVNLQTIPLLNTSNVTNMNNIFYSCGNLQTIPQIDTSNVIIMDRMFIYCGNLRTLPELDASKVNSISTYFRGGGSNLTDVGGWKNLKINWNDNNGLVLCPNLTYQSCINILNGLYDFVGNGSTETRTLKVHQNFLTTVGDEINIGVAKGWSITA